MNPLLLSGSIAACPDCAAPKDGLCSTCVDFAALDDQTAETPRHLQNLIEDRPKLAEVSISERHDPIMLLPPEVVSLVFAWACRLTEDSIEPWFNGPMELSSVCRRWREIARSSPAVWASISIRLPVGPHAPDSPNVLRKWIDLAGQLPLSIRVICRATRKSLTLTYTMHRILQVLSEFSHRWLDVSLELPKELMELVCGNRSGHSTIQVLSLKAFPGDDSRRSRDVGCQFAIQKVLPNPKKVFLQSMVMDSVKINWHHLTDFTASRFRVIECLKLFRQCPLLESCSITNILKSQREISNTFEGSNLKRLCLKGEACQDVLNAVTLPSLEKLEFKPPIDAKNLEAATGILFRFLARSESPLRDLKIAESTCHADIVRFLQIVHTVNGCSGSPALEPK